MRSRGGIAACLLRKCLESIHIVHKRFVSETWKKYVLYESIAMSTALDILSMCGTRTWPSELFMLGMQNPGA